MLDSNPGGAETGVDDQLSSALQVIDEFARQFVRLSHPFSVALAESVADREAAFRLRFREVVDRGWAAPTDYPDGIERDDHDDDALHAIGWTTDQILAGYQRMVLPSPQRRLPTEVRFDLTIEPWLKVVDVGRTLVAPPFRRDGQYKLLLGLQGFCWLELRRLGFSEMCGIGTASILRLYHALGIETIVLGPARLDWGEERSPFKLDVLKTAEAFMERRQLFFGDAASHNTPP